MEEPRGLKLTGTNRSIGLNAHLFMHGDDCVAHNAVNATDNVDLVQDVRDFSRGSCRPGGYAGGSPPDPIPNSVVKSPRADGTMS